MTDRPLITIILPAFNAAAFIAKAIGSVIGQTYTNWELIIINDGSTDETEDNVKSIHDARIRYFSKINGGVSSARNIGLKEMKGEYFCFLDADDEFPPRSLEARLDKFRANPELEFVDGVVQVFDESLSETVRTYRPRFKGCPLEPLFLLSDRCFLGVTWMVRRMSRHYEMAEDIHHGEDYFFFLTLARNGGLYDYTNEVILHYRRHSASAMRNIPGLHQGYRSIYDRLRNWPEFRKRARIIYNFRTRKIVFLSYLSAKEYFKAFRVLFS